MTAHELACSLIDNMVDPDSTYRMDIAEAERLIREFDADNEVSVSDLITEFNWLNCEAPASVSIDNGASYGSAMTMIDKIMSSGLWDALVNAMDDGVREIVAAEMAPCTEEEFLSRYLELAPADLIIG